MPNASKNGLDETASGKSLGRTTKIIIFSVIGVFLLVSALFIFAFVNYSGNVKDYTETTSMDKIYPNGDVIFVEIESQKVSEGEFRQTVETLKTVIENQGISKYQIGRLSSSEIKIDIADPAYKDALISALNMPEFKFVAPDSKTILTAKDVSDALVKDGQNGQPEVELILNSEGTKKFETATREYLGQEISIYIGDTLIAAPTVQAVIPDGNLVISSMESLDKAKAMARVIKESSNLPYKLKVINSN